MAHIDLDYALVRETKRLARNTGTKVARVELDEDGQPTGKVTLRNGKGETKGSFTVKDGETKVHKAPVKREKRQPEADTTSE